ncbi:uncharacterized protein LOC113291861 [Papaver somniferum]|uniref:uncharacterized protein LOC113291861 n=1 Tax=Papaver somniferum TaxID=3469 RepID=UPI000E6FDA3E|nr:uncharacterized protein LOC113291861 [Papaver somniferum]
MATRLGKVLNKLISEEQVVFMKDRNIHENVALASELINEINANRKFGNVGLKMDIAQAFDTVSWKFIKELFRQYGFYDTWCGLINCILNSARISIMVNGSPEGFFSISRGLRQGDPLSPLIFVLIEDIISRNLSKLFARRSMHHMVIKKGVSPTHLLFAGDILVFCRGNLQSLQSLLNLLDMYQKSSGQCVNFVKSKFYFGGGSNSRARAISIFLGMERAFFPDKYLGIQLKPSIVRHIHVRKVVEKIMDKFAGWKGKLLYFQARLVLIKSVISSYVIHSMAVYKWPCSIIKKVERAIRNFLWSGDAEKRKHFTVLYDSLCCSRREGGLGIPRLLDVTKDMLMKLWISIRDSDKTWARFLSAKYLKNNGNMIDYKLGYSVFPEIRLVYNFVQKHTRAIIGDGASTYLFFDNWCDNLPVIAGGEDYKIWDLDKKGIFYVKSAKAALKDGADVHPTATLFSRNLVHPTLSIQYWKIWVNYCCASDDNVIKKTGRSMPSPAEDLLVSYKSAKGRSRIVKGLWLVANLVVVTELWKLRNKIYFEDVVVNWLGFKGRVYQVIRDNSIRLKGHMYNTVDDLRILNYFKVQHRSCKISRPIEVSWSPPFPKDIMICCDGASFGNPGKDGAGVIVRDANSAFLGAIYVGLGWQTNFIAEVCAIIYGMMLDKRWMVRKICIRSDSKSCLQSFQNGALPWQLQQKWRMARSFYDTIRYVHSFREANFAVDSLSKQACLLAEDTYEFYEGRPGFILSVEWPGVVYFRFH